MNWLLNVDIIFKYHLEVGLIFMLIGGFFLINWIILFLDLP